MINPNPNYIDEALLLKIINSMRNANKAMLKTIEQQTTFNKYIMSITK